LRDYLRTTRNAGRLQAELRGFLDGPVER